MRALFLLSALLLASAAISPARGQDTPAQAVIDAITRAIGPAQPPIVTAFERVTPDGMNGQCGMQHADVHISFGPSGTRHRHRLMLDPQAADGPIVPSELLAVIPRIAVDADGAARAYHPDDPYGSCNADNSVCALDEFSSGGLMVFSGAQRTLVPRRNQTADPELAPAWRRLWPLIRDKIAKPIELKDIAGPNARGDRYLFHSAQENVTAVFNRHIIPSAPDGYPCMRSASGRHPGYFVAATTLNNRVPAADRCNPALYLDSEEVPFFVLPQGNFGKVKVGDIVVGHLKTGARERTIYGIVGDTGPIAKFGEGSIYFNQLLLGKTDLPMRNKYDTWKVDQAVADWNRQRPDEPMTMTVLVLGDTRRLLEGEYSRAAIERVGAERFRAWSRDPDNPTARLNACAAVARQRTN